jgi:hypothetical protein
LVKTTISAARLGPCTNTPSKHAVAAVKHLVIVSSTGRLTPRLIASHALRLFPRGPERLKRIDHGRVLVAPFETAAP